MLNKQCLGKKFIKVLRHIDMNSKLTIKEKLLILHMIIISPNLCLHHQVFTLKIIHIVLLI